MAEREVELTETQKRQGREVFPHFEMERGQLIEDARTLQQQAKRELARKHGKIQKPRYVAYPATSQIFEPVVEVPIIPTDIFGELKKQRVESSNTDEETSRKLYSTVTLKDKQANQGGFTITYLTDIAIPYVDALIQIQYIIDEIYGRSPVVIRIHAIHQGSVVVDITGGIPETIKLFLDIIVPWRRNSEKRLVQLAVSEKQIEVAQAKAVLAREENETEDNARLLRAQIHQQELENQKTQLEIEGLALKMVRQTDPNLSEEELQIFYAMKMFDPTRLLATSSLEFTDIETTNGDVPPPIINI